MPSAVKQLDVLWNFALLCSLAGALPACTLVGPASISQGRPAYNEVLSQTNDEQMLLAVVRRRYGDSPSLLTVTNVTASLSFSADTSIQAGFGPSGNFAGNLVPFSAGVAYEENPTISYAPVGGNLYTRQLLSPISLELLVGFLRSRAVLGENFAVVVQRINGIRNPDFLSSPTAIPDPRFSRLVKLLDNLHRQGVLSFGTISAKNQKFALIIRDYVPSHWLEVQELMKLLDLPAVGESKTIVVPMSLSVERDQPKSIAITTRSLAALFEIMTATVEVSEEQARSSLVVEYPSPGLIGRQVQIRRSESRPSNASVRVKYRDAWYYISDTDLPTKQFFRFIELLWGIAIASSTTSQPAPVLTVPVTR